MAVCFVLGIQYLLAVFKLKVCEKCTHSIKREPVKIKQTFLSSCFSDLPTDLMWSVKNAKNNYKVLDTFRLDNERAPGFKGRGGKSSVASDDSRRDYQKYF